VWRFLHHVCKDVTPYVAIIARYSTTFRLEFIHAYAVQPQATRGCDEGISGAFGSNTIMACICRDEPRNRMATPSDDDFFARLHPVKQCPQLFLTSEALTSQCAVVVMISCPNISLQV
jgi:hypothetical protein